MFLSIKRPKDGSTWMKKLPLRWGLTRPAELFQDLSLPLNLFRQCLEGGDLTCLTRRGRSTPEQLAIAWAGIYSQYIDLNADNETSYVLQLQMDIAALSSKVQEVETCIYFLWDQWHDGLIDILVGHGYPVPKDFEDKEGYRMELQVISNRLAPVKLQLTQKEREYASHLAGKENDEIEDNYFDVMLSRLAKYQGVGFIHDTQITTKQFVILLKDYLSWTKRNNQQGGEDGDQG